jgi:hypothetical protein
MLACLTDKAVFALEEALDGDDPRLRVTAAQEILNRALGRPHTTASVDVNAVDPGKALVEALMAINAKAKEPAIIDVEATPAAGLHTDVPLAIESGPHADE